MSLTGIFPDSTWSLIPPTLSVEVDTFPLIEVISSLVSWMFCHRLSRQSHWKKYILQRTTWVLLSRPICLVHCSISLAGMTTLVYLQNSCFFLTHLCHWIPMGKSASNNPPLCNTFHLNVLIFHLLFFLTLLTILYVRISNVPWKGPGGEEIWVLYSSWQLNTSETSSTS